MANVKSSKSVQQSRVERGLNKIPPISKKNKKILVSLKNDLSLNAIVKRLNALSLIKDERLLKKYKIERILSDKAKELYEKNDGKICWGAIVRSVKEGNFNDFGQKINKTSRNEHHNFEVNIKRSEISKYEHILTDELYSKEKKVKENKGTK